VRIARQALSADNRTLPWSELGSTVSTLRMRSAVAPLTILRQAKFKQTVFQTPRSTTSSRKSKTRYGQKRQRG
jgi:hypothetical protein